MPKAGSAQFSLLTLDGASLLGAKVKAFAWSPEALQEDTTGLGDSWTESTPTGIRRAVVSQSGAYFDTAAAGMHETLRAMPLPARTLIWSPDGVLLFRAVGTLVTTYEVLATNGALTKANVVYTISGALESGGAVIQAPEDKTSTWTGPTIDNGTSTAGGGQTTQIVTAKDPGITGFVGKLRHSTDGSSWVDLAVFANVTTAPNQQTMPVVGTINRYLQYVGTITGTGTIRVSSGLFRN